ncbi:peptidase family m20/M25/M40 domain-containing protein [Phthorimaea operculella]|nr:peptidase family m20/M25/M40 domain-containing protein [Phthorimaea operculella]
MTQWENREEIQRLQEYLRIESVHPCPDYESCVTFLQRQASEVGLPVRVMRYVETKPVVVMTWEGADPSLPSILLNSHMDVVPVSEECWMHPPFGAEISEDGMIYARGIQDMKCMGMLYLEAIRRMKQAGVRLKRTVHVSFVPVCKVQQAGVKLKRTVHLSFVPGRNDSKKEL